MAAAISAGTKSESDGSKSSESSGGNVAAKKETTASVLLPSAVYQGMVESLIDAQEQLTKYINQTHTPKPVKLKARDIDPGTECILPIGAFQCHHPQVRVNGGTPTAMGGIDIAKLYLDNGCAVPAHYQKYIPAAIQRTQTAATAAADQPG